ncbi:calcium-binding protein [Nioella sp.]|uniref:calcium-binding protein n=1 Tax=Nioella sp. TaxID=1912091 RepID=UPI003A83A11D
MSQNDTFVGTSDGEAFDGGSGADDLDGNGGNDTLNGGSGNDTLNGGAGEDTFGYSGGADVIEDFSADFLQIDSSVLSGSLASVLSAASVVSGNLVLDFGGGNTLTLNGITDTAVLDGRVEAVNQHDPESDLTGDGTSDILWRNGTTGSVRHV